MSNINTLAPMNFTYTTVFVRGIARVSFPTDSKPAVRWRALKLYQPFGRLPRAFYKLWCRIPLNTYFLNQQPTQLALRFPNFDWQSWLDEVADKLNSNSLTPAFWFPRHSERTRALVILHDDADRPVACAKLADGDAKHSITSEIAAFDSLNEFRFDSFEHPKKLLSGTWEGTPYIVLSYEDYPLMVSREWEESFTRIWLELVEKTGMEKLIDESLWRDLPADWLDIRSRIEANRHGSRFLHCAVHGDFMPWNILTAPDHHVLIDWEFFAPCAPYFTDPAQFVLCVHLWGWNKSASECATALRNLSTILEAAPEDVALSLAYLAGSGRWPVDFLHDVAKKILIGR